MIKLFVWKGILRDYTCGVAFALACSEEEAKELILSSSESCWDTDNLNRDLERVRPDVYDQPYGYFLPGGA